MPSVLGWRSARCCLE